MPYFDKHKAHRIATKQAEADERAAMLAHMDPATQAAYKMTDRAISACEDLVPQVSLLQSEFGNVKAMLQHGGMRTQKAGSVDVEKIGSFFKAAVAYKLGAPELAKSAEPWSLDVSARGGLLVPASVQNEIDAAMRLSGSLLGACTFTTVEPGATHRVPAFSNAPVSAWQLEELDPLIEFDVEVSGLERAPKAVGGYLDLSLQLFSQSSFAVGQAIVAEVLAANQEAIEAAIVNGEAAVDSPTDGLLRIGGTHSQSALATATSALLSLFIAQSLEDNPSLWKRGTLVLSPPVAEIICASEGASSYRGRFEIDQDGALRYGRWPVVIAPSIELNVMLADLRHVHYLSHGATVIIDTVSGAKNLKVTMAVASWANFGASLPGSISKAVISSLV